MIATSGSAIVLRLFAIMATLACAADEAVLAAEDQEETDGPAHVEERLVDLVADAQRRLQLSGYDTGPIDGQMGLRTQRAIRAYQAEARRSGTLEALKGPGRDDAAPRPELVGVERPAPRLKP